MEFKLDLSEVSDIFVKGACLGAGATVFAMNFAKGSKNLGIQNIYGMQAQHPTVVAGALTLLPILPSLARGAVSVATTTKNGLASLCGKVRRNPKIFTYLGGVAALGAVYCNLSAETKAKGQRSIAELSQAVRVTYIRANGMVSTGVASARSTMNWVQNSVIRSATTVLSK